MNRYRAQGGFSLVELMISTALAVLLLGGVQQLLSTGLQVRSQIESQVELTREARFAMRRIVRVVRKTDRLILPQADNPGTDWQEHIRVETVPASAPEGSSTLATAVLAVGMPAFIDLDFNGFADADNDLDGRINEDPSGDVNNDLAPGIFGIDDDGDGSVDEEHTQAWLGKMGPLYEDDDEDDFANENGWTGLDEDGDGAFDEDPKKDMNSDALPGIGGVDDDGDGTIDEGDKNDDDEDGLIDEDWVDSMVFYLSAGNLIERHTVPWDENSDLVINGRDFIESTLAENISLLRFERIVINSKALVDITLTLTRDGESISLNTQIRVGSGG